MSNNKKLILAIFILFSLLYIGGLSIFQKLIYPLKYRETIATESRFFKLDPILVAAVIFEESKFDEKAESKAGALGLMQLMPETAAWAAKNLQMNTFSVSDLYDPQINIRIGCWYLRFLLNKYEREDLALAAYNSGHQNVDRWMKKYGITKDQEGEIKIGFDETRHYVKKVKKTKDIYRKLYGRWF